MDEETPSVCRARGLAANRPRRYGCRMVRFRRFAAAVAAYALVLQALLTAFAGPGAAFASADPSVICRSDAGNSPAEPATHELCSACLAGHCAPVLAGGNTAATPLRWPVVATPVAPPAAPRAPVALARDHQHSPRAPPLG